MNWIREEYGYPPLTFKHGEDKAFWPYKTFPNPEDDDSTKTLPIIKELK